jgi:hypothetical protein
MRKLALLTPLLLLLTSCGRDHGHSSQWWFDPFTLAAVISMVVAVSLVIRRVKTIEEG